VGLGIADFIVIAVLVGAGCLVCSVGLWVMLRQAASSQQRAMEDRLAELAGALKALEAKTAELGKLQEKPAANAPAAEIPAPAPMVAAPQTAEPEEEEDVSPETLVVIAAAVTAYLGKKVRIRSAKMVRPPHEAVSAWAQHGRMLVHSSHNPRARA
jgi:hypothetical protein